MVTSASATHLTLGIIVISVSRNFVVVVFVFLLGYNPRTYTQNYTPIGVDGTPSQSF